MPACPLCGEEAQVIHAHLKPPAAGVRIPSVDGGKIRGVVPLQSLRNLETTFNRLTSIEGPIQEHFDLAGNKLSSSGNLFANWIDASALTVLIGGLIILRLFSNGWSV